jgi:CheY-like chemotaxis protein
VQYAKAAGADGYLKKPVEPMKLYKMIDKALNR